MKMRLNPKTVFTLSVFVGILFVFTSCQKDASVNPVTVDSLLTGTTQSATSAGTIAVAAERKGSTDSIYVVNACSGHDQLDSVSAGSLPAAVSSYLSTNYSGYAFQKAFSVDSSGTATGYIVIIQYNNKPVGLAFDASGNFVKVLEQREGHDLHSPGGFHQGGMFDDRGKGRKDSVALSSLPATILTYFTANYPQDTLIKAYQNRDSSIVVLSTSNGVYATVFTSAGVFVKRAELPSHEGKPQSILQTDLPGAVQNYLTTTYPNYVFKQAFALTQNGTSAGYVVFIDANNTKYAVEFDASGNFVKAVTVR